MLAGAKCSGHSAKNASKTKRPSATIARLCPRIRSAAPSATVARYSLADLLQQDVDGGPRHAEGAPGVLCRVAGGEEAAPLDRADEREPVLGRQPGASQLVRAEMLVDDQRDLLAPVAIEQLGGRGRCGLGKRGQHLAVRTLDRALLP